MAPASQTAVIGTGAARLPGATGGDRSAAERFFATSAGRIGSRLVLVAFILLAWEYAPVPRATRFWMSSPSLILGTLWDWLFDGTIWTHLESTLLVMSEGYVIGCAAGIGLGFLLGFFPRLSASARGTACDFSSSAIRMLSLVVRHGSSVSFCVM